MPICPNGHDSADKEYCDICGRAMSAAPAAAAPAAVDNAVPAAPTPVAGTPAGPCPNCGAPLEGRFCEVCGHDSLVVAPPSPSPSPSRPEVPGPPAASPPQPRTWTATVRADRAYYDTVMAIGGPDAGTISFPQFCPDRYFPLRGNQISIGRRSASRGINPDIDLTGPPEDPGVSHLHAMLIVQPDGTLSIVDMRSSNGTTVNNGQNPLPPNVPHPLSDGDRIHIGAWTTITFQLNH